MAFVKKVVGLQTSALLEVCQPLLFDIVRDIMINQECIISCAYGYI